LAFSISDTGTVNAQIKGDTLMVFADTMSITESYIEEFTITADDGFTPTTALFKVQVNPSPFVKDGAVQSYTLTADTVTGNTADIAGNPKKIALTDIFGGGSDSLFYQIIDTTSDRSYGPFFKDDSSSLSSTDSFIPDVSTGTNATTNYAQALDDTLRIQASSDTVFTEANAIAIRVTDGQVFEDDTVYVNFTSVQAQTLGDAATDTVDNFDLTINGSDTTFSLAKWEGGFGGTENLEISVFKTGGDSGAVVLDTLANANDEFTFSPSDDSTGTVTFTYRSTDQNGVTNDNTFSVTTLDSVLFDSTLADFQTDAANGDTVIFNLDTLVTDGDGNYEFTTAFTKKDVALASVSEDTLTITPRDSGVTDLILTATDGNGGFAHDTVQITVTGTTFIPAFDSALSDIDQDTVLLEGEEFEFTYSATSTDSADMIYKFAGVTPSGAALDSTTGLLTWTPTSFGEYSIRVTAFNANNREYNFTDEAQVDVINAPTFTAELGDTTVATGDTLAFTFAADPYEGGSIASFELDSTYDDSASISSNGAFQFIPGVTYNGDYDFTVTVTDDKGASATSSFTVNVTQTQPWGDVTGNGVMNATDATNVLRHVVGLDTLSGADSVLANVSGAGGISSLDASLILRKVADSTYDFPVEREGNLKAVPATGEFTLANMSGSGEDELALNLNVDQTSGVKALTVTINYDAGLNELTAIESALPEGWMFFYNDVQEEGVIKISAAGTSELTNRDELITLRFNTMNVEMPSSVNADVTMNEESTSPLADVLLQAIPSEFALNQNYPNPFNPTTNIKFALPQSSVVKLEVFNVLGQRVATLVNGELNAGYHTVMFDASNLASGVYVYRINTAEHMQVKRMMLIK
ncbi:MAG: T9SS type A sorting domain-containing protein, partial [Balneolaceae bacterium]|nr:T9SS type A sorting domain-containing protein [Balneolaceae bacterium]